ncbi:MAG: histidine kinase [Rhodocyclaceae bacterium]|nr:histidine kinase [Rhodocyclaceae bacterium]
MAPIVPQIRRARYPLFVALAGVLGGCAVAVLLSAWGSAALQNRFADFVAQLAEACAGAPDGAQVCPVVGAFQRTVLEQGASMLMLQFLCMGLLLVGIGSLGFHGYRLLVRRMDDAVKLPGGSDLEIDAGRDEFDHVRARLATLHARAAGLEAESAWHRRASEAQARRAATVVRAGHEVARLINDSELSEGGLASALGVLAAASEARAVGLVLEPGVCRTLGLASTIAVPLAPMLAEQLPADHPPRPVVGRLLAGPDEVQTLLVPLTSGDIGVGTLLLEFAPEARLDDTRIRLAETVARILSLAIVSLSDSAENRRVALLEERSAIAAELHDSLAQSLGFMRIQLARLQRALHEQGRAADDEPGRIAAELRQGLAAAYGEVRELISTFRARLDGGGLLEAVQQALVALRTQTGITVSFDHALGRCRLEVNEEFHILQLIREALSNIGRHSCASAAWVDMRYGPGHEFVVVIDDDGRGLAAASSPADPADGMADRADGARADGGHHGLSIMRERIASLGGALEVIARPGGGTRVRLAFPPKRLPTEPDQGARP